MPASLDQCHLCNAATITLCTFPSVIPPHKNSDFRIYVDKSTLFLQLTTSTASFPTPIILKGNVGPRESPWPVPMTGLIFLLSADTAILANLCQREEMVSTSSGLGAVGISQG